MVFPRGFVAAPIAATARIPGSLYTDGLAEARDAAGTFFMVEQVEECLDLTVPTSRRVFARSKIKCLPMPVDDSATTSRCCSPNAFPDPVPSPELRPPAGGQDDRRGTRSPKGSGAKLGRQRGGAAWVDSAPRGGPAPATWRMNSPRNH